MYSNINIIKLGEEPREKTADGDACDEEENQYEAADPEFGASRMQTEEKAVQTPEREWRWGQRGILVGMAVLGLSVLLNLLLLTAGAVQYLQMANTLERTQAENQRLRDVASCSFLIYSESHKLCVNVTASGSLTAAPCRPDALSQHFLWLSGRQLFSMAHMQCVAAPQRRSRMSLRLEPCQASESLQHWECRANGLLALARENLYFNYGNSQSNLVMLYTGDGPWSRWVIYGRREDLCSHSCHSEFHRTSLSTELSG